MSITLRRSIGAATAAVLCAQLLAAQAQVGETPEYKFSKAPWNGVGIQSLADLQGKPTLVDFWGTHCPPCVHEAVPTAVKIKEEYGDAVNVLMIEVQGSTPSQMQAFALKKKWLGVEALWTTERPFNLGLEGIPHCALLSPTGEIVVAGMFHDVHGDLEEALEAFVKKPKLRKDLPSDVAKAVLDFDRGNYAAAFAALASSTDKGAVETVQGGMVRRLESMIARVDALGSSGYVVKADALAASLSKGLSGNAEWTKKLDEAKQKLATPEMDKEREAEKALEAVTKKLFAKGPEKGSAKALEAVAQKHAGTKVGARAGELAKVAMAAETVSIDV